MPRFVILDHDHPFRHLDFMIESGDRLRTWRLLEAPAPGRSIAAEAIGDHRKDYLDYTGPVSGGRGRVERWDTGAFTLVAETTNEVQLLLWGDRVRGSVVMRRLEGDSWEWRLNES